MADDHYPFGKTPISDPFEQQAVNERARRAAFPSMSDQEIRARALECAVRHYSADTDWCSEEMLWAGVHKFEAYIRDGVT